ncbi:MAG: DUF2971 domain-containing protein [Proteobacteria bacterium]|nr:DUF2971 domain-containing protein [Pseudomonadota bacterium]
MSLLSHYTTRAGLEGIAKTRTFWATNFLEVNDTSEFFYGWQQLYQAAIEKVMGLIPNEKKLPGHNIETTCENVTNQFRQFFQSTDNGYGHLYVTSFARGKTEDHDKRGIRTLWELYNGHKGYCLQFDQNDVQRMLDLDSWKSNYESLGMAEVKYGVDRKGHDFGVLCYQLTQQLLLQIIRTRNDIRVEPQWDRMWADSAVYRKLMEFCATHKDPCYEDERELRIFAYPSIASEARVFTGIASKKQIRTSPSGKQYIAFGEHWKPGIAPKRVIIGTKADGDIDSILANYSPVPQKAFANMPIA